MISGRRFETITLHTVLQRLSVSECEWLLSTSDKASAQRANHAEACKRRELLEEFVYWFFDSFIMQLLKVGTHLETAKFPSLTSDALDELLRYRIVRIP